MKTFKYFWYTFSIGFSFLLLLLRYYQPKEPMFYVQFIVFMSLIFTVSDITWDHIFKEDDKK